MKSIYFSLIAAFALSSKAALAGVCDYKPSKLIGGAGTAAVAAGTGAMTGAAAAGKAAGIYTIAHASSGAVMLGSTAGGASAAGTVGIMGGTAGAAAATMGAIMNPLVWIPAAVTAVGVVGFEGGCYIAGK